MFHRLGGYGRLLREVWVQEVGEGVLWSLAVSQHTHAIIRADIAGTCQTIKRIIHVSTNYLPLRVQSTILTIPAYFLLLTT